MTVEIHVAELDQRLNTAENNIDKMWGEIRNECTETLDRGKEYTDSKFREASLQMVVNSKEVAKEVAEEVKQEISGKAWSATRIADIAFKAGLVIGLFFVGANNAQAMIGG